MERGLGVPQGGFRKDWCMSMERSYRCIQSVTQGRHSLRCIPCGPEHPQQQAFAQCPRSYCLCSHAPSCSVVIAPDAALSYLLLHMSLKGVCGKLCVSMYVVFARTDLCWHTGESVTQPSLPAGLPRMLYVGKARCCGASESLVRLELRRAFEGSWCGSVGCSFHMGCRIGQHCAS